MYSQQYLFIYVDHEAKTENANARPRQHFQYFNARLLPRDITGKRGSAAVVRTTCCPYGKGQILHISRAETTLPIITKFWTISYVGEIRKLPNLVQTGSTGASPHVGEMYTWLFFLLVSLIRLQTTIRNGFWCFMAQKTSFGVRMSPLSIRSVKIECKGVKIPKSWPSREIPAKTKTFESTP